MSSLAHELRTKVSTAGAELYIAGCKAFEAGSLVEAAAKLAHAVRDNEPLLRALAKYYLEHCVAPDMTGAALSSAREGQKRAADGYSNVALPRGSVEGEGGQSGRADRASTSLPPSLSPVESGGATGQLPIGQRAHAPPLSPKSPAHGGAGQGALANRQQADARPAVRPKLPPPRSGKPRGMDAIAAVNRTLFDTFKVRGRVIGDLTVFEARQIAATNEREARILRAVCDHVAGHVEPGTPLRQAVKLKVLERAFAQNMEASDAA